MSALLTNIKLTLRVLARSRVYTLINLSGLVMGLTISFLLLIFALNELSYNDCFTGSGRIYRVITRDINGRLLATSPYILKKELEDNIPAVEKTARIISMKTRMKPCSWDVV